MNCEDVAKQFYRDVFDRYDEVGSDQRTHSPHTHTPTQRTPPYYKYYAIVTLLCAVNLLSHTDLLSRPPCADIILFWFSQASLLSKKGSQRSKHGGEVKHDGAVTIGNKFVIVD